MVKLEPGLPVSVSCGLGGVLLRVSCGEVLLLCALTSDASSPKGQVLLLLLLFLLGPRASGALANIPRRELVLNLSSTFVLTLLGPSSSGVGTMSQKPPQEMTETQDGTFSSC